MAYTSCSAAIAANIQIDCSNPLAGGYTGRALGFELSPAPTLVRNAQNELIISDITLATSKKFFAIENFGTDPFTGSNSASNADGAVMRHVKTFVFDVPKRGADASKEIVDPLTRLPLGFGVIAERKDGKYELIGIEAGLRVNADGVASDAYTKDGVTTITASCSQYNYEYEFFDTDKATTQTKFETLLSGSTL